MKKIFVRFLLLIISILSSSIINTYYIDHLLLTFNIMSYIALLLNRVSLTLFFYFVFDILIIERKIKIKDVFNKLFLVYMIWLIGLLFGRFTYIHKYNINEHFNFHSYLPLWINHLDNPLVRYYIVGNILVYLPFGLFIRYHKNLIYSVLYCVLLILLFETLQGVTNLGYFDIDDILLNGIGGLFGIGMMHSYKFFFKRKQT